MNLSKPIVVTASDLAPLLPKRNPDTHKGDYGYIALIGGCIEYSGAVKLANFSQSALRSGCGVAVLAVPSSLANAVAPYLLESTLFPMPGKNGHMIFDEECLKRLTAGKRAIAVGMGWGRTDDNIKILDWLLKNYMGSLVIDADGLWALSNLELDSLKNATCHVILTPHHGEFSRLCGKTIAEIVSNPTESAGDYAKKVGAVVLLKGHTTTVTDGEKTYLVDRGCAGMATAGSGDVLSGVLAGLLGYLPPDVPTVALGAYLCGLAGEYASRDVGEISMLSGDTVKHLPEAIRTVQSYLTNSNQREQT